MRLSVFFAFLISLAATAFGQIQVALKLPRLQYVAYEPVVATIKITNLAGRQHARLFGQDRLGARKGKLSGKNSSQDGGKNPHEHAAEKFALQIAESVTKSFHENRFIRAVIFAEPHFLGLIKQHLHPRVSPHIEWIGKDLAKAGTPDLEKHIGH